MKNSNKKNSKSTSAKKSSEKHSRRVQADTTPARSDSNKETGTSQPPPNEHINPSKKWADVNQPKEHMKEEYLADDAQKTPGSFGGRRERNSPIHVGRNH